MKKNINSNLLFNVRKVKPSVIAQEIIDVQPITDRIITEVRIKLREQDRLEDYLKDGQLHYEDGPIYIFEDEFHWILYNRSYTFEDWCKKLNKTDEEIAILKLKHFGKHGE